MPHDFKPTDPAYKARIESSFADQAVMKTLGIDLVSVESGRVTMSLRFSKELTQQHGFIHAGILGTALDSACGYAALSLMRSDATVLTVENKLNLLRPAEGESFTFVGEVIKPGRTLTVSEGKAFDMRDRLIATMTATNMSVDDRPDVNERFG